MKGIINKFFRGECHNAYKYFGAHPYKDGYIFRVYAPNALKVEVIGDFNHWNGKDHEMDKIDNRGIYELYIPEVNKDYQIYRYNILTKKNKWIKKSDPYAFFGELRPNTASKTFDLSKFQFSDERWMKKRTKGEHAPLNIYEIHLGSFVKKEDGSWMSYDEIAPILVKYLKKHHFTHVEFMPVMEHPYDGSWGYQCSQYFSITSRYGNPSQLKNLVNTLHKNNIGVIIDFVPVHFVMDDTALGNFDGGRVYESFYLDKRYSQWGTYLFDYSKPEVMSFMLSCAAYYLDEYHIDGIRFDAISNMIYKDGNKNNGEQSPNINWMKKANYILSSKYPTAMLIAEDSSDYPLVTKPTFEGGLGYDYKWDLGWMNDTLKYFKEDPYFRGYHINLINFSMYYFYNEKFMLPFSHDEVVHMKGTIINKISGSYEQKFQQLRTLYTYMFTHPGKKLNFMGNELALFDEWDEEKPLYFDILKYPIHDSFNRYFIDLCKLYKEEACLYEDEYNPNTFRWISCDNTNNIFIFERFSKNSSVVVVLNFSSIQYEHYRFHVSNSSGYYVELLNSDQHIYSGYGCINNYNIHIDNNEIGIKIPSFGAVVLKHRKK